MKKFLKIIVIFVLFISSIFVVSCAPVSPDNDNQTTKFYYDDKNIIIDDIKVSITYNEYLSNNNNVINLTFIANNTITTDKSFILSDLQMVNTTTDVAYEHNYINVIDTTLKYDINSSFPFRFVTPTSTKQENYFIKFVKTLE